MDRWTKSLSGAASICASLWACSLLQAQVAPSQSSLDGSAMRLHMVAQVTRGDWIVRGAAIEYCAAHQVREALSSLERTLADGTQQPWLRGRALVAIARLDSGEGFKSVLKFASESEPILRAALAEAAVFADKQQGAATIARLLEDVHPLVKFQALASYAQVHGEEAWQKVDKLTSSLPEKATAEVKRLAMRSLALVGTADALVRLEQLADGDGRAELIRAIKDVRNPRLIPFLLKFLAQTSAGSSEYGALLTALQRHPRGDVITSLKQAVKPNDLLMIRMVASVNAALLNAIELGPVLQQAIQDLTDETTIRVVLGTLGDRRMNPSAYADLFRSHLKHNSAQIRIQAMRCLAHCPDVDLYAALQASVAGDDDSVVEAALLVLLDAPMDRAPRGRLIEYLQKPLSHEAPPTNPRQRSIRELALALLGKAGDQTDFAPAFALLNDRLRSTDPQRRQTAAAALGQIAPQGAIPQVAATQGYIIRWMVVGTFLNDQKNAGFNTPFPPEEGIDFTKKYVSKYVWNIEEHGVLEREISWTKATVDSTDGKLIVPVFFPPPGSLSVGFAVADLEMSIEQEALLDIDGDDAFRVWLNGEKIAEKVAEYKGRTACVAEQSNVKIKLKKGANRLVVKTSNIDHDWWVRLRITDANGRPLEAALR